MSEAYLKPSGELAVALFRSRVLCHWVKCVWWLVSMTTCKRWQLRGKLRNESMLWMQVFVRVSSYSGAGRGDAITWHSSGTLSFEDKSLYQLECNLPLYSTPPHIQSRLQTGLSNIFKKLPNTHFSFYIYTVNRKVCVWAWYEWYVCWYWKSLLFVFLLPFFLTRLIG